MTQATSHASSETGTVAPGNEQRRSPVVVLDPTSERRASTLAPLAERPASVEGRTVALLDISKPRGDVFLDRLEERLAEHGVRTERFRKPTFTKPAPVDLRHEISQRCEMVIEALAD